MSSEPTDSNTELNHPFPVNTFDVCRYLQVGIGGVEAPNEVLLLWPPNLFAFTSDVLSRTGAYTQVISPSVESGLDNVLWPPRHYAREVFDYLRDLTPETTKPHCKGLVEFMHSSHLPVDDTGPDEWKVLVSTWGREWRQRLHANFTGEHSRRLLPERTSSPELYADAQWIYSDLQKMIPAQVLATWVSYLNRAQPHTDIMELHGLDGTRPNRMTPEAREKALYAWRALKALLTLHAVADIACVGWGIRPIAAFSEVYEGQEGTEKLAPNDALDEFIDLLLKRWGTLSTINPDRSRILPKRHNPEVGITLRSLSSNLGYHRSSIDVSWERQIANKAMDSSDDNRLSVLLLPWPLHVKTTDFVRDTRGTVKTGGDSQFFTYQPHLEDEFSADAMVDQKLEAVLRSARLELGTIDLVVLPELAIGIETIPRLEEILRKAEVSVYIAGVRAECENHSQADDCSCYHTNAIYCKQTARSPITQEEQFPGGNGKLSDAPFRRLKHHRWKLNDSQVVQYGLGYRLQPTKDWWEGIHIGRRMVRFLNVGNNLTICPLICEDLARQDPIADLIRTVGPSLVVTILMDGPQLSNRWSARYASVLADDPGSSVLTLTSAGMVDRYEGPSSPYDYHDKRRVVSLWRDQRGSRELVLEPDASAIAVTLNLSGRREKTVDGRIEEHETGTVTFGGAHQIRISESSA